MGDHWFGGITRNPWNSGQGSSGSSAGPASATAAGCVAFSIGSETLGSISSASNAMQVAPGCVRLWFRAADLALKWRAFLWSMDKLGPICRKRGRLRSGSVQCDLTARMATGPDGGECARDVQLGRQSRLAENCASVTRKKISSQKRRKRHRKSKEKPATPEEQVKSTRRIGKRREAFRHPRRV